MTKCVCKKKQGTTILVEFIEIITFEPSRRIRNPQFALMLVNLLSKKTYKEECDGCKRRGIYY